MTTPPAPSDIAYAAHTSSCTFLLDAEGICRRIVPGPRSRRRESSTAAKCIGAQYVASLDARAAGGLAEMPRPGTSMLFARVDERGRVSLVRTGTLTSFEPMHAHDPFVPSCSVETSAPMLEPDPNGRTQQSPALRPERIDSAEVDELDLATSEYPSRIAIVSEPVPAPPRAPAEEVSRLAPRIARMSPPEADGRARPPRGGVAAREDARRSVPPAPSSDVQLARRTR